MRLLSSIRNTRLSILSIIATAGLAACGGGGGGTPAVPWGGPLAADMPLAKSYNDAALAFSQSSTNPIIKWNYRIWCQTGYRTLGEAGTGQPIDTPTNPAVDLVSPLGFIDPNAGSVIQGGAKFLDNAWYFGTDVTGMVVVRFPDGSLAMFDALTTPADMQAQTLDQMRQAGLDPTKVKYIFIGHEHSDHYGGVNLVRQLAPGAQVVATTPAATAIAAARTAAENRTYTGTPAEQATAKAARLFAIPERIDIKIDASPNVATGMKRVAVAPDTEVVAALAPGHTLGQMNVIVPVVHQGKTHKLLIWSGNDSAARADQYAASTDFLADLSIKEGANAFINTHAYQSALFGHLRSLKANPNGDNPLLMGTEGVRRYLGIYSNCQRALAQRLRDGTWKAM